MADKPSKSEPIKISVDPVKTPTLAVDSYLISSNEHLLIFSYMQAIPLQNQQQIVARVALTRTQAKEFAKNLEDHIQKFEI
jgi:hypothetical protein